MENKRVLRWCLASLVVPAMMATACSAAPSSPTPTSAPKAAAPATTTAPASSATTKAPEATKPASPATAAPAKAAAPSAGADVEAAKKEGKVVYYTSTPVEAAQELAKKFEARYGIKVEVFRSGGEATLRRFMTEADAGKVLADVMTITDPAAYIAMAKQDRLVAYKPAFFEKVPDAAKDPEGYWVAQRLNLANMGYRTDKVQGADIPKKWTDLTDPKYSGKMVHADPNYTATALMAVAYLSKQYGWEYYEKLAKNKVMIVQGAAQISSSLTSGERVLAAYASDSYTWRDREKGQPVQAIFPEDGVFVVPAPTAVMKGGPNPNAAKLLADFMLSDEALPLYLAEGLYGARADAPAPSGNPPLDKMKLVAIDYDYVEKNSEQIKEKFSAIFD